MGRGTEQRRQPPSQQAQAGESRRSSFPASCRAAHPALPCHLLAVSLGSSLPLSAASFVLPAPGADLIPPGSVQSPGQTDRERKWVSQRPFHLGDSGLTARPRAPWVGFAICSELGNLRAPRAGEGKGERSPWSPQGEDTRGRGRWAGRGRGLRRQREEMRRQIGRGDKGKEERD